MIFYPRETSTLQLLVKRLGQPSPDYFPDSRTPDQHFHLLRKKLGHPELIETVRGVGYRVG